VTGLAALLSESARRVRDHPAVAMPGTKGLTYGELDLLSSRIAQHLLRLGVTPGDRVGVRLHKSPDAVAAIFGILKAGAAYVPVDADSPAPRGAYILNDCAVRAVVTERRLAEALELELRKVSAAPTVIALEQQRNRDGAWPALLDPLGVSEQPPGDTPRVGSDDIAYVLYTSGSTGNPKGVSLSHGNATSFIDWCSRTFQPTSEDTFSSHAPFHFDLSILDIFVPLKHGAKLVLIGEELGKDPLRLAAAISAERISVWYSTPSILSLLAHYGKLERHDCTALRLVLFAGEVFPVPQFRLLWAVWQHPRYFNLYGPTETNVCTYYEVPADATWVSDDSFPIGRMCPPNMGRVVDERGEPTKPAEPGELIVTGPNVMQGYWNLPEQTLAAFLTDSAGAVWYRTGDIVVEAACGEYRYLGRRDRMVKRRGYRVELGEVEAALLRNTGIREAAAVAVPGDDGVRIAAFVVLQKEMSILALRRLSADCLPPYMVPDLFKIIAGLPRTSTNKVDLQRLRTLL